MHCILKIPSIPQLLKSFLSKPSFFWWDTVISRISHENFSRAKNFAVGGYVNYGKFSDFNIANFLRKNMD